MKPLVVHSNGMGQQSVALYLLSSLGHIPRFDYSVFVDPGAEDPETNRYYEYLKRWGRKNKGVQLIRVQEKNIENDLFSSKNSTGERFVSIPAFTKNRDGSTGILRRQCTEEYKIEVINKFVRQRLYKLKPKQWLPNGHTWVMGITLEEMHRISNPRDSRSLKLYPFLSTQTTKTSREFVKGYDFCFQWTRSNCTSLIASLGLKIPPKSACYFCPYKGNQEWKDLKANNPDFFDKAVELDRSIRDSSQRGIKQPIYLHRSCVPLDQVDFDSQLTLNDFGCESGMCGV